MTGGRNNSEIRTRRTQAAFTLVETMVGSVLAVIVFGALLVTIAHGYGVMEASRQNLRATQLLVEKMETLRLYSWNQIISGNMLPAQFQANFSPADDIGTAASGVVYYGTVSVDNLSLPVLPTYAADMRQVTVSVTWTYGGITHQRSMSTFVARNGIQNYVFTQ